MIIPFREKLKAFLTCFTIIGFCVLCWYLFIVFIIYEVRG